MEPGLVAHYIDQFELLKEQRIQKAADFIQGNNKPFEDVLADLANICMLLYVARRSAHNND